MNNNNMEYYNLELVECNCCGTRYGVTDNNIHGYYNCCYECGDNKYEEEQEEKETPVPQLTFDMISKILNIRMESKKDDRYKKNFNECMKDIDHLGELQFESWSDRDEEEWEVVFSRSGSGHTYTHYYRIENIFETILEWKIEDSQESTLDDYLESQE